MRDAAPGTLWANLGFGSSFLDQVGTEELEEQFEIPDETPGQKKAQGPGQGGALRVMLVDFKRAHSLSIELAGIKRPMEQVRGWIQAMDLGGLEAEQLAALGRAVPTDQEKRDLLLYLDGKHPAYRGISDPALLGPVERCFLQLLQIPRPGPRLRCCLLLKVFGPQAQRAREQYQVVAAACAEVKASQEFARLMGVILAVVSLWLSSSCSRSSRARSWGTHWSAQGNHLNTSSGKGPAAGFTLVSKTGSNTLLELANVKGRDKRTSLLQFAVQQMDRAHPGELETVLQMAPLVRQAGNIQLSAVKSWQEELAQGLREMQREIQLAAAEQQAQDTAGEDRSALQAFLETTVRTFLNTMGVCLEHTLNRSSRTLPGAFCRRGRGRGGRAAEHGGPGGRISAAVGRLLLRDSISQQPDSAPPGPRQVLRREPGEGAPGGEKGGRQQSCDSGLDTQCHTEEGGQRTGKPESVRGRGSSIAQQTCKFHLPPAPCIPD